MLAIQLPDDIERRLDTLAKATGRSKESYLQEAIVEYLGDLEDFYLAEQRLADVCAGRTGTANLADVTRSWLGGLSSLKSQGRNCCGWTSGCASDL